jgi:hypothetical protein
MKQQKEIVANPPGSALENLSLALDCETLSLMRRFIAPILETAASWPEIADRLAEKGYGLGFREGHLVILNAEGVPLCTGRCLGVPLRRIAARIGRPCIRVDRSGQAGILH